MFFVGDDFLRNIYQTFVEMRSNAIINKTSQPYLFDFFNVSGHFQSRLSGVKGIACIFNAFLEGLNARRDRTPRFVIFVMDKDFITTNDYYNFGTSKVFQNTLQWLIRNVNINLKRRRTELFAKKPGALALENTKVIWVKMIKRPYGCLQEFDKVFALHNRFNNTLEEVLLDTKPQHYILSIKVDRADFHLNGELSHDGEVSFWREVDDCLKLFDRNDINLKPKSYKDLTRQSDTRDHSASQKPTFEIRWKMPTPPPRDRCHY